jgi:hypothetical protein
VVEEAGVVDVADVEVAEVAAEARNKRPNPLTRRFLVINRLVRGNAALNLMVIHTPE